MGSSDKQAHIPVVLGVAVAEHATYSFVEQILAQLRVRFEHTDWLVVVASGAPSVRILARIAGGALTERELVNPRLSLRQDSDMPLEDASATYLLRTCSVVFKASGDDAPPLALQHALKKYAEALPLSTPNAGNNVSVFSLPEPAPIVCVPDALSLEQLKADARDSINELLPYPLRVAARLLRREKEEEPPCSEPEKALFRTREVLRQWARIDEFNRDAREWEVQNGDVERVPDESPLGLRRTELGKLDVSPEPRPDLDMMNRAFIAADNLSGKWQRNWSRLRLAEVKALASPYSLVRSGWQVLGSLFVLAILAALFLALASEFADESPFPHRLLPEALQRAPGALFFVAYASILMFGLWRLIVHRARRIESRHQDYRLLAEGLRIQFFWSAAAPYGSCAENSMHSYVADHIPLARRSAMFWVRGALHAIRFSAAPARSVAAAAPLRAKVEWDSVGNSLIKDQLNYGHRNLVARRTAALRRLRSWSRFCLVTFLLFFVALLVRAVSLLLHMLPGELVPSVLVEYVDMPMVGHWLVIGMVVSLVVCLSASEAAEGFGLEAEIRRGEATNAVLESATRHWRETHVEVEDIDSNGFAQSIEQRERLLFELGRLMIDDYSEWFHIHRERPAQPIHG